MNREARRRGPAQPEAQDVASATECTGLMPALPPDEEGEESCASLGGIHGAKGSRERRTQGN